MIAKYIIKHIKRMLPRCAMMAGVSFVLMLLLQGLLYAVVLQREALDEAIRTTPIKCVVSDSTGANISQLEIIKQIPACLNSDGDLAPYIRDVLLLRDMDCILLLEDKEQHLKFVGTTSLEANMDLDEIYGVEHTFYSGYSDADMMKNGIVISTEAVRSLGLSPGQAISLRVRDDAYREAVRNDSYKTLIDMDDYPDEYMIETVLIGEISGVGDEVAYCAWPQANAAGLNMSGIEYSRAMSFYIADNYKLDEFQERARAYFGRTTYGYIERSLALTVYDDTLTMAKQSISRNINMILIIMPILFVLSIGVGFMVSFLFIRGRRQEFAVMRSLGTPRGAVFGAAFGEQLVLCLAGIVLSFIVAQFALGGVNGMNLLYGLVYLVCFMAGAALSVIKTISVNAMSIMKAKE